MQVVVSDDAPLRRLLEVTGLTRHLDCVQSLPDALLGAAQSAAHTASPAP